MCDGRRETPHEPPLQSHPWTTTHAQLTLKPLSIVDLTAQAEYDPALNRARRYSVNLGLMDHRGDLVRVLASIYRR